jgi:hypothetical protein
MSAPVSENITKRPRKAAQEPVLEASTKKRRGPKTKKSEEEPKAEAEADAAVEAAEEADDQDKKKKRFFQVVSIARDHPDGAEVAFDSEKKWLGNSPSGAARKAAYRIFRDVFGDTEGDVNAIMGVREYVKPPRESKTKKVEEEVAGKRKAPKPVAEKKVYRYTVTRVPATDREPAQFGKDQDGSEKAPTKVTFKYDMVVHKYPPKLAQSEVQEEAHASA